MALEDAAVYRILVAEDDEDFLTALESVLAADGRFAVAGRARNGHECLDLAGRLTLDAVVMDIEMPELDGVEATQMLREQQPDLPVVAISGHDYEERVLEIRTAGAQDYVRKSRVDEDLVGVLVALLRS
jgi:DNA-binding NarL/FixJ family response regulator